MTASFIDTGECKKAKGKVRMRGKNSKSQLGNLSKLASNVYGFCPTFIWNQKSHNQNAVVSPIGSPEVPGNGQWLAISSTFNELGVDRIIVRTSLGQKYVLLVVQSLYIVISRSFLCDEDPDLATADNQGPTQFIGRDMICFLVITATKEPSINNVKGGKVIHPSI